MRGDQADSVDGGGEDDGVLTGLQGQRQVVQHREEARAAAADPCAGEGIEREKNRVTLKMYSDVKIANYNEKFYLLFYSIFTWHPEIAPVSLLPVLIQEEALRVLYAVRALPVHGAGHGDAVPAQHALLRLRVEYVALPALAGHVGADPGAGAQDRILQTSSVREVTVRTKVQQNL